jgi:nicotinamide-nucleotide amidase
VNARTLRTAEVIAVGSELLIPPRLDTNSLAVTERLASVGIEVRRKLVVGDDRADLDVAIRQAIAQADVVVLTGGLGPTDDDLTRDAVAAVLGRPLREDPGILERIRQRFAARGARMPDVNRRQALVPEGAAVVPNERGTAPGLWIEHDGRVVILLPGPPNELTPMFDRLVDDRLAPIASTAVSSRCAAAPSPKSRKWRFRSTARGCASRCPCRPRS